MVDGVTARAPDLTTVPTHQHESFQRAYVLTHTLPENFPGGHPSLNCSKSSTLNFGVSKFWAPEKKMHLVDMGSTYQIF